jgi:hypothetical protein
MRCAPWLGRLFASDEGGESGGLPASLTAGRKVGVQIPGCDEIESKNPAFQ